MTYKVVVNTWYEPEYIDYDRQPGGGEQWYEVVESTIPWNNVGKGSMSTILCGSGWCT